MAPTTKAPVSARSGIPQTTIETRVLKITPVICTAAQVSRQPFTTSARTKPPAQAGSGTAG